MKLPPSVTILSVLWSLCAAPAAVADTAYTESYGQLFTIDLDTGTDSVIGPTGLGPTGANFFAALAFGALAFLVLGHEAAGKDAGEGEDGNDVSFHDVMFG